VAVAARLLIAAAPLVHANRGPALAIAGDAALATPTELRRTPPAGGVPSS